MGIVLVIFSKSYFNQIYEVIKSIWLLLFKNILNDHYSFNINEKSSVLNQMILPLLPIIIATGNKKNALFGNIDKFIYQHELYKIKKILNCKI